ncbi:hypothetical protein BJV78DRAFT_494901 [Lactifluus subvellereus]|nr:hypothetical protein BJV78DRAFT_494901 [Lactifluus subvellereus]
MRNPHTTRVLRTVVMHLWPLPVLADLGADNTRARARRTMQHSGRLSLIAITPSKSQRETGKLIWGCIESSRSNVRESQVRKEYCDTQAWGKPCGRNPESRNAVKPKRHATILVEPVLTHTSENQYPNLYGYCHGEGRGTLYGEA